MATETMFNTRSHPMDRPSIQHTFGHSSGWYTDHPILDAGVLAQFGAAQPAALIRGTDRDAHRHLAIAHDSSQWERWARLIDSELAHGRDEIYGTLKIGGHYWPKVLNRPDEADPVSARNDSDYLFTTYTTKESLILPAKEAAPIRMEEVWDDFFGGPPIFEVKHPFDTILSTYHSMIDNAQFSWAHDAREANEPPPSAIDFAVNPDIKAWDETWNRTGATAFDRRPAPYWPHEFISRWIREIFFTPETWIERINSEPELLLGMVFPVGYEFTLRPVWVMGDRSKKAPDPDTATYEVGDAMVEHSQHSGIEIIGFNELSEGTDQFPAQIQMTAPIEGHNWVDADPQPTDPWMHPGMRAKIPSGAYACAGVIFSFRETVNWEEGPFGAYPNPGRLTAPLILSMDFGGSVIAGGGGEPVVVPGGEVAGTAVGSGRYPKQRPVSGTTV